MSTFKARIKKLEGWCGRTAQIRAMTDEQLESIVKVFLIAATPEEIEAVLVEHPEFRELFEELLPQVREQREVIEALATHTRAAASDLCPV